MADIIFSVMDNSDENNLRLRLQELFDLRYVTQIEFTPTKLIAYGSVGLVAAAFVTGIASFLFK